MSEQFEVETAVEGLGGGRYRATFSTDWWVHVGPNGGIAASTLLRACSAEVAALAARSGHEPRLPRTLTVHYLAPPRAGEAQIDVTVERTGRGVTFLSARLAQGDRAVAVALAAYAAPRPELDFGHQPRPEALPPELCLRLGDEGAAPSIRDRWECRVALGPQPSLVGAGDGGATAEASANGVTVPTDGSRLERARSGGWIRLARPSRFDHHLIAAMADGWLPPVFTLSWSPQVVVPTLELTVHFRDSEAIGSMAPDDWAFCTFSSDLCQEGFIEEDGLIWNAAGRLIADCRQLAVVGPRPAEPLATEGSVR